MTVMKLLGPVAGLIKVNIIFKLAIYQRARLSELLGSEIALTLFF